MIDKGYKEIKLIKYPSGLYAEAGHKQGATIQESRYSDDSTECGDEYVADVQDVYGIIVGIRICMPIKRKPWSIVCIETRSCRRTIP